MRSGHASSARAGEEEEKRGEENGHGMGKYRQASRQAGGQWWLPPGGARVSEWQLAAGQGATQSAIRSATTQSRTRSDAGVAANHCCNKRPVVDLSLPHPPWLQGWGEQGASLLGMQAVFQLQTYPSECTARWETSKALSLPAAHWVRARATAVMTWNGSPHPSKYLQRAGGAIEFKRIYLCACVLDWPGLDTWIVDV